MNKWLTRSALAFAAMVLAMVPAGVDVPDGDIDLARASCQNEDCMPQTNWVCGGRGDKCNLKYEICRAQPPTYLAPESANQEVGEPPRRRLEELP